MEVRNDPGQLCGECGKPAELAVKFSNGRSPTCGGCIASALGVLHRARSDAAKPKPVAARMEGFRSVVRDLRDLQEIPRHPGFDCPCESCTAQRRRWSVGS